MTASRPIGGSATAPRNDGCGGAPRQGGAFQWVQAPPGDSLQPEATGAGMEETKCLKPSDSGSRFGDRASVQAAMRVSAPGDRQGVCGESPRALKSVASALGRSTSACALSCSTGGVSSKKAFIAPREPVTLLGLIRRSVLK